MRLQNDKLARASLEEGEDADARFLRATIGKPYGGDVVEYRVQLLRTFDVQYELWINGRVLLSGKASTDLDGYLSFQAGAEQVRVEMLDRLMKMRSEAGKAKVRKDAERVLEPADTPPGNVR